MDITRIDTYDDERFSKKVLNQHGAYLISGDPYEIEIINTTEAIVRGNNTGVYPDLIEYFRFHAPHIIRFSDEYGKQIVSYPSPEIIDVEIDKIQPSQFFIDEEKLDAIRSFANDREDIIVQVLPWNDRFISLDGHTRLYLAVQKGFRSVKAVISETDDWVWTFVHEAENRGIISPKDMILLPHERYEIEWNQYCDKVFADENK